MMKKMKAIIIGMGVGAGLLLLGCSSRQILAEKAQDVNAGADIRSGDLRKIVFSLLSSAENSSLDYAEQYSYIEDIGDGRGYTGGIIGFTSGTGDMLEVVREYCSKKPENNPLSQYLPALEAVNGSDSLEGLGEAYVTAWIQVAEDEEMIAAQDKFLEEMYLNPAVEYAKEDGLSVLGQYIYYDAVVVHGPGDADMDDCFEGIRAAALQKAAPPSQGGEEAAYLTAFLDARAVIMKQEEAHSDLSRLDTQRKFMREGKYGLELPLQWNMYGDEFSLTQAR